MVAIGECAAFREGIQIDGHPSDQTQGRAVCVLHAKALHGNPFDGHTLGPVVTELESLTGAETHRIHVDRGYRGHNHAHKFRVWISFSGIGLERASLT